SDEPAAAPEHGALRRGGRHDPAGDAGLLPDAEDAGRPGRFHGRQDPLGPRLRARAVSRLEGLMTSAPDKTPSRIAGMFDSIAPRYDLLNRVLSLGLDQQWRKRGVAALQLGARARVLDLCSGTADLAIAATARYADASVVGIDFS